MKSWIPYVISLGVCALSVPIFLWLIKSKFKRKTVYLIITGLAVCVICQYLIFNVSFPVTSNTYYASPDEIYYQTNRGAEIQAVVDGEKSVLVFAENHGNYYAKTDKGYQFSPNNSTEMVFSGHAYFGIVSIYRYLDSNDYYVIINENMSDGNMNSVSDNKDSEFQQILLSSPSSDNNGYIYLTCVHDINNYSVTINGSEFEVNLN